MTWDETIELMNSDDYQERFIAEYWQTKIRYDRLHEIIIKYSADTLGFTPASPMELLEMQASNMGNYLKILEIRAEIEGNNIA